MKSVNNKLSKAKSSLCTFSSFWESLAATRFSILNGNSSNGTKARFSMLLLEFGEYFFEDFSCELILSISSGTSFDATFNRTETVRGRLKLCSRCIVFEPNESSDDSNSRLRPLIKFPYKSMSSPVQEVALYSKQDTSTSEGPRMFSFTCTCYWEMLADNRIGPYQLVEFNSNGNVATIAANSVPSDKRIVLSLLHSDLSPFIKKVNQLRFICAESKESLLRIGAGRDLRLQPFIDSALQASLQFNASNMVDFHEHLLLARPISVNRIGPLTCSPGGLMVTNKRVYFQPSQINNTGSADSGGVGIAVQFFSLSQVQRIFKRRYLLRQIALEFLLITSQRFLFVFDSTAERDHVYSLSLAQTPNIDNCSSAMLLDLMMQRWLRREISNFEYLMFLNNEADRSCNDLTQYPVFPHVIADFKSKKLNLNSPSTFRDLSKPIGALNPERLQYFKDRFNSMSRVSSAGGPPPFLYGTHYSTPGYVLHYLVRVAPEYMLCLQNGKFDAPDRMFHSLSETWESCLNNPTDLIELIPEFFTGSGEFLRNSGDLDLGFRQSSGERVSDVILPPWADSAKDFIRKHNKALESEYVSEHLHHWIDLIFGYKQRGVEAVAADNLYYYLTYEGAIDLDAVQDSRERAALEMQIQEFGQTPKQLFFTPHPFRVKVAGSDASKASSASGGPSPNYTGEARDGRGAGSGPATGGGGATDSMSGGQLSNGNSSLGSFFNPHALSLSDKYVSPEVLEIYENVPATLDPSCWAGARLSDMLCDHTDENITGANISRSHDDCDQKGTNMLHPVGTTKLLPTPRINSSVASSMFLENSNTREMKLLLKSLRPANKFQWHADKSLSSISIVNSTDGKLLTLRVSSMDTSGVVKVHAVHLQEQVVDGKRSHQPEISGKENRIDREEIVIAMAADLGSARKPRNCCQAVWISCYTLVVAFPEAETCLYRIVTSLPSGMNSVYKGTIALGRAMSCVGIFPSRAEGGDEQSSATGFLITGHEDSSLQLWTIPITTDEDNSNVNSELLAELQWFSEIDQGQDPVRVTAVGLHQHGMLLLVAAGSVDGRVFCWANGEELDGAYVSTGGFSLRFRYNASLFHRAVTCLEWIAEERCLCATMDGRLLCLDWNGNLLSAVLLDSSVQCLSATNVDRGIAPVIFAGCQDGSVRAWKLCPHGEDDEFSNHKIIGLGFTSLWVWRDAHAAGYVCAISFLLSDGRLPRLISAGEDGTVALWNFD